MGLFASFPEIYRDDLIPAQSSISTMSSSARLPLSVPSPTAASASFWE